MLIDLNLRAHRGSFEEADARTSGTAMRVLRFAGHHMHLLMDELDPLRRLEQLLEAVTGDGVSGVWRLAVAGAHVGDLIVVNRRLCYLTLAGRPTRTLGDMLSERYPARAGRIREILKGAVERGARLGETLALLEGFDAEPIRDCLRTQLAERLAALVRLSGRVEGKRLALLGSFDSAFTFDVAEVTAAARASLGATVAVPRVLFVDDDVNVQNAVRRVAKRWSIALDCEASSSSACARAKTDVYDLIVLDYVLPDANGLDLSTTLRALQPGATFVLASGMMDRDELRRLAARHSIDMVLEKPFDPAALEALLHREIIAG